MSARADATTVRDEPVLAFDGVRAATGDPEQPCELTLAVPRGAIVALLSAEPLDAGPLRSAAVLRLALGLERPERGRIALFGTNLFGTNLAGGAGGAGGAGDAGVAGTNPGGARSTGAHPVSAVSAVSAASAARAVSAVSAVSASRAQRAALRRRVGVVWRGGALFDDDDVASNVGFPLRSVRSLRRRPAVEVARAVRESLLLVGLQHIEHVRADELAEGVRCRVALARAIAPRPELLLLDDPSAGLDPLAADSIAQLVAQLRDRLGLAVLVVSRDARWALPIADHVTVLRGGRIAAAGSAADVRASTDPAVQQLLAPRALGPLVP